MSENLQPRKFGRLNNLEIVDLSTINISDFESAYANIMQAYKVNPDQKPIIKVIRNLIKHNKDNTSMKNDSRYFNLYLIIIESYVKKLDLYKELQNCQLFNKLPEFYKQYALELQKNQLFDESKDVLRSGIRETESEELQSMLNSIKETPALNSLNPTKRIKIGSNQSTSVNTNIFDKMGENVQKGMPLQGQVIQQPKRVAEQYSIPQQNDHLAILQKEVNDPNLVRKYDFYSLHPISFDYSNKNHRATMKTFEQVKYEVFMKGMHKNITTRRISKTPANKSNSPSEYVTPIPAKFDTEPTMTFHTRLAMNDVNSMFKTPGEPVAVDVKIQQKEEEEFTQQLYANPSDLYAQSQPETVAKPLEDSDLDLDDSFIRKINEMENKL